MKITPIQGLFILGLCFLTFVGSAQLTVAGYTNRNVAGFDVLVEDAAMNTNASQTNAAVNLLQTKLNEILQFNISQVIKDSLMAVPIFVDWNTTTGAAVYHPGRQWLIDNGYPPEKAKCVEISNVTNFINWTNQNQPYMVLHELAHAFHHRALNFSSSIITNAFNNAVATNLYKNVQYHTGGGNYITQATAYALSNEIEYFAEITEAYFGLNDYFPFDYDDLKAYDSIGFNCTVTIWGDIKLSQEENIIDKSSLVVYPNPSSGLVSLSGKKLNAGHIEYELVDPSGKVIEVPFIENNDGSISFDLSSYPSGTYFLKTRRDEDIETLKIMKF